MKYATMWYGIQIRAEDDDEERILRKLYEKIDKKAEHDYEDGEIKILDSDYTPDVWGFTKEEIEDSKLVIEFNR